MVWIRRHSLIAYFVLAYVISWSIWSPLVASAQGLLDSQIPASWHLLGAFGPLLASFIVTGITGGAAGIRELIGRMLRWRVGVKWVLIALSPAALFVVSAAILWIWSGAWPDLGQFGHVEEFPELGWFTGWVVWVLTFGLGEETGWRGFALPRLQRQRSALSATLLLGLIWVLWHLPAFFYNQSFIDMGALGALGWAVSLFFGAIVLTWLYNSTGGSISMVILFHGTLNAATSGEAAMIVSILIIVAAIVIVRVFGPANLSRTGKQII